MILRGMITWTLWIFFFSVLMTANFKAQSIENMEALLSFQPNRPILVSEFWPGWFDHWFEPIHNTLSVNGFTEILTNIFNYNASVNFYMFHGGTNFGFMNGANHIENYAKNREAMFPYYAPDVTSYGKQKTGITFLKNVWNICHSFDCTAHGYYSSNDFIYAHDDKNIFTRPTNA